MIFSITNNSTLRFFRAVHALLIVWAVGSTIAASETETPFDAKQAEQFLRKHCVQCHNGTTHEADLRLDNLAPTFTTRDVAETWTDVMDRVNQGEMPPESEPRPDAVDLQHFTVWIAEQLQHAADSAQSTGGKVVLRRMNRREYNNTLRDLLGIEFRPADSFPEDPPAYGFDNVGSALTVSPLHIEKYMAAARDVIDQSIVGIEEPRSRKWRFEIDQAVGQGIWLKQQGIRDRKPRNYAYMEVGVNSERDGHVVLRHVAFNRYVQIRKFQVHRPGRFLIRIRAKSFVPGRETVVKAAMRLHDERTAEMVANESTWLNKRRRQKRWTESERQRVEDHFTKNNVYDYGPARLRITVNTQPLPVRDVENRESEVFEFPVELDDVDLTLSLSNDYAVPMLPENFWLLKNDAFPRPELLVDWIEVEGPLYDQWPPTGERRFLADASSGDESTRARRTIAKFMSSAFRRPVRRLEVDEMMSLFEVARQNHRSFESAIKVPMVAVLSSPSFLYLVEPNPDSTNRELSGYEVASRLSYFLWSTMPDNELYKLAHSGELLAPDALRAQVDRMLADEKSREFVENFARQWLGLREMGAVEPDARLYPNYDVHLLESMVGESTSFFAEVLHHDHSVLTFLKADFTTLNERLARFYGIQGVRGTDFRKVTLKPEDHRGGVLRQASVHMVTSNGTRTSPVKRGAWILQNLLDSPTPPPPPNAGDIAPGVPGINKATVRVRLEAHRNNAACMGCHAKIDPLGFALENYNAIGTWRDKEGFGHNGSIQTDDPNVDASGKLDNGREFAGVDELTEILLEDKRFLRCLTVKLMTYGLGRGTEFTDRATIEKIVNNMPQHGYTLRGIIKDIVTSEAFLRK